MITDSAPKKEYCSNFLKIPMADSVILATAWTYKATIWTQDSDFEKFSGVKYFPKTKSVPIFV